VKPRDATFALVLLVACSEPAAPPVVATPPPVVYSPVTHGVAAGDVSATRATIWARSNQYASLHVSVTGGGHEHHARAWVSEAHDYAGSVQVSGLVPNTEYTYSVWFTSDERWEPPAP